MTYIYRKKKRLILFKENNFNEKGYHVQEGPAQAAIRFPLQ